MGGGGGGGRRWEIFTRNGGEPEMEGWLEGC